MVAAYGGPVPLADAVDLAVAVVAAWDCAAQAVWGHAEPEHNKHLKKDLGGRTIAE